MGADELTNQNSSAVNDATLCAQAEVGNFFRDVDSERKRSAGVFDSASSTIRESMPSTVKTLLDSLPTVIQKPGRQAANTQQVVMDCIANRANRFKQEFGHDVPDAVYDSVIRKALPLVNQEYAKSLGLFEQAKLAGVYDEVSNVSGGAMNVSQVLTAIMLSFTEQIPFAGVATVGRGSNGLEGRIIQVTHTSDSNVGGYKSGDNIDGLNSGKPFMQSKRFVDAVADTDKTKYTAKIKLSESDAQGCPIRHDTASVYINGLIAVTANPSTSRKDSFSASDTFRFPDNDNNYAVLMQCPNKDNGEIVITINPALPEGSRVRVSADIDFEHSSLKGKRPAVRTDAIHTAFRIHYASGYYKISSEAKHQWQSDVNLDPATQATIALRNQYYNERHMQAIDCMYEIAQSHQNNFSLDWLNRLSQRSIGSVVQDLYFSLSKVDTDMVMRTQFSSLGVIYVGRDAIQYFEAMDPSIFVRSGIRKRPGIFRLGKWCGQYDVYFTPSPKLNRPINGAFQMLCIGRSDQVAGNPYITGDALSPIITPFSINNDGEQGSFYFGALSDTVNPFSNIAAAASLINVTDLA